MYYILLIPAIFIASILAPVSAGVTSTQYGQYGGGGIPSSLSVNKLVSREGQTKAGVVSYVDNFSPSDPRFRGDDRVYFQIKVKNTSNTILKNVQMNDILPEYIDAIEGPGDYNSTNRTISWSYPELRAGEERTESLVVQIKPQAQLPSDRGTFCINNKAVGRASAAYDEDTAQFCIEKHIALTKGGVPAQAPKAGADFGLIFGAINIAGLGAGIYLRRRT